MNIIGFTLSCAKAVKSIETFNKVFALSLQKVKRKEVASHAKTVIN